MKILLNSLTSRGGQVWSQMLVMLVIFTCSKMRTKPATRMVDKRWCAAARTAAAYPLDFHCPDGDVGGDPNCNLVAK